MKRLLVAIFLLLAGSPVMAWFPHGGSVAPPPTNCTKAVDGNCVTGVAAGGIYYGAGSQGASPFLSLIAQSGQTYTTDVAFNRCGVEYGCGPNKLDSAMTDVTTLTNGQIPGCGAYNSSTQSVSCVFTCSPSSNVTIDSLWVHDTLINVTDNGCHVIVKNSTIQSGPFSCLNNNFGAGFAFGGTSSDMEFDNDKFMNGPECSGAAELWGTPAATGAGMTQASSFTGTFISVNGSQPGFIKVGTGTTGTMYRKAYVDWPGRTINVCCSGPVTPLVQLTWFAQWIGTAHTSGTTLTVDSTDAQSPAANPTGNTWLTWNDGECSGAPCNSSARLGVFVSSCTPGSPTTCALAVSSSLGAGTAVSTGTRSCAAAACDNGIWLTSLAQTAGPVAMTTGPMYGQGGGIQIGQTDCVTYKARFNYILKQSGPFISKANCAVDSQSNYYEMSDGQLGYTDASGGVPHIESVNEEPGIGSTQNIAQFVQNYETLWTDKWNIIGDLTGTINFFSHLGGNTYQTTWGTYQNSYDMSVVNSQANNLYDDGGLKTSSGYQIRLENQADNSVSTFAATTTNNGDGTGTLHVSSVSGGSVAVGQFINCATNCLNSPYGVPLITAQITTQGADVSTWTISHYYGAISGTVTGHLYPGIVTNASLDHLWLDTVGSAGASLNFDYGISYTNGLSCSTAVSLTTGGPYC